MHSFQQHSQHSLYYKEARTKLYPVYKEKSEKARTEGSLPTVAQCGDRVLTPMGFGASPARALTQQEKSGLPFLSSLQPHVRGRVVADLLLWAASASPQAGVFPTVFRKKWGTPMSSFSHTSIQGFLEDRLLSNCFHSQEGLHLEWVCDFDRCFPMSLPSSSLLCERDPSCSQE